MIKAKRLKNTVNAQRNVKNTVDAAEFKDLERYLRKNHNVVFDFSFGKSFNSCRTNRFDNRLRDAQDFIDKFKDAMRTVGKLSKHSVAELFDNSNDFRHCHDIDDKDAVVREIIETVYGDDEFVKQNCEGERFYQAGYEKGVRFIGIIKANVFYVVLTDYFHDLYPDDKRNTRSRKSHNYSIG